MPTIDQAIEFLKQKRLKFGGDAHTTHIIISEESKKTAIENKADEQGLRRTMIGLQTYSPEAYSSWHATMEYLIERCAFNPILAVDLVLLLVQEARQATETDGVDGIDIALGSLFKVNGDYEAKLREAKAAYRARKKRS